MENDKCQISNLRRFAILDLRFSIHLAGKMPDEKWKMTNAKFQISGAYVEFRFAILDLRFSISHCRKNAR
jgi:hypothetical protein